MMIRKEYMTVCENDIEEFDNQVNFRLEGGWMLYGNPYSIGSCNCQALVKIIENTIDEPVNNS